jgi:hypothetical protein
MSKDIIKPSTAKKVIQRYAFYAVREDWKSIKSEADKLIDRLADVKLLTKKTEDELRKSLKSIEKKLDTIRKKL